MYITWKHCLGLTFGLGLGSVLPRSWGYIWSGPVNLTGLQGSLIDQTHTCLLGNKRNKGG